MFAQYVRIESREVRLSRFIRQFHRWVSALFALSVIATAIALAQPEPIVWVSYAPLLPLALLAISGVYLFFLPYAAKWRARSAG